MAGKVDSATHAAAFARGSEAVKHEAEILAQVHEIVHGSAFRGSHRSQEFLRHVVEQALHGAPADLRERSIGTILFGRPADYDTADDAIVRVTASDVRKRLLQHYGNGKTGPRIRITLPAGSYIPEFAFLNEVAPAVSEPVERRAVSVVVDGTGAAQGQRKWSARALIAGVVLLLSSVMWWASVRTGDRSQSLIADAFGGMPRNVQVIVADDALVLIQVLLGRRFTLEEYENFAYLNMPDLVRARDLQQFWGSLSTRQITNIGDLQNANRIARELQARGWDVGIRLARQMHARSFRTGNFVILGSSFSNPWADLFPVENSGFPLESLPRPGKPEVFLNRKPLNGEPLKFEAHIDARSGKKITFARASLLENAGHSGRVLLVGGQSMSATEMAGEYLLRSDAAPEVRRLLGLRRGERLPDLEMMLRVSEQNEIGDSVELVSARRIDRHIE